MRFTYCPQCGKKTILRNIGDEGNISFCSACNLALWDIFRTCVIVAVVNENNEVALLRQGYVSEHMVCVAGVIKFGESPEATALREVKEELGLDVVSLSYVAGYPYAEKDLLMLGYKAVVKKDAFRLSSEVDAAAWIKFADALPLMREGSIAKTLVAKVIDDICGKA